MSEDSYCYRCHTGPRSAARILREIESRQRSPPVLDRAPRDL